MSTHIHTYEYAHICDTRIIYHMQTYTNIYNKALSACEMPFQYRINQCVPIAKEPYKRDNILQKRPIICKSCSNNSYGEATISRLLKIIGFFGKKALYKRQYSTKGTYNLKGPTNRSHPKHTYVRLCVHICMYAYMYMCVDMYMRMRVLWITNK